MGPVAKGPEAVTANSVREQFGLTPLLWHTRLTGGQRFSCPNSTPAHS